ncbi:hypothetical protein NITHO_3210011 [Nitrolancea hollandica Lb]|uniref:Uncharacterized protein n=1 Tax=Nitrolancea hollandica Lb TaxID=1129897 RepID=I4EHP1_9BACT|nr:hypothetical protein NITHO_3210011 [Nitrolancea hollandica Lb]
MILLIQHLQQLEPEEYLSLIGNH